MIMKRFIRTYVAIALILVLSACSNNTGTPNLLSKEGIAPYELSEQEAYLLNSLGISSNTKLFSSKAPKAAKSLSVNVYVLDEHTWKVVDGGQISLDKESLERLEGLFTMMLKDNYAIDFSINTKGRASYETKELNVDFDMISSSKGFLEDFQLIEMNKEIPVAIMMYDSGTSMRSHNVSDFFSPSKFGDVDLVQAVTLTFSEAN